MSTYWLITIAAICGVVVGAGVVGMITIVESGVPRRPICFLAGVMTGIVVLLLLEVMVGSAAAHEVAVADGTVVDYTGLRSPGGGSCCGNKDCGPVPSEYRADGLWIKLGDLEVKVQPDRIQMPLPGAAHVTHACWDRNSEKLRLYCVFGKALGI